MSVELAADKMTAGSPVPRLWQHHKTWLEGALTLLLNNKTTRHESASESIRNFPGRGGNLFFFWITRSYKMLGFQGFLDLRTLPLSFQPKHFRLFVIHSLFDILFCISRISLLWEGRIIFGLPEVKFGLLEILVRF